MHGFEVKKLRGRSNLFNQVSPEHPFFFPTSDLHSHRLRGHDGEVLGRGEVRQPEGVPEHDVLLVQGCRGRGGDPGGQALRGRAGGLRDVAAGGVELGVVVWWKEC